MKVAGLFPSRGLLGSQMMEAVDANLEGHDHVKLYSHDLPIPESFNHLVLKFLETSHEYAWFVEEDVVTPDGGLNALLDEKSPISFIDYPLKNRPTAPCYGTYRGKLIWIGLGCTLVHRRVFEKLGHPWFETQWKYVAVHEGSAQGDPVIKIIPDPMRPYGGQDLFFCYNALKLGFDIRIVMGMRCRHPVPVRVRPIVESVDVIYDKETTKEAHPSGESRKFISEPAVFR